MSGGIYKDNKETGTVRRYLGGKQRDRNLSGSSLEDKRKAGICLAVLRTPETRICPAVLMRTRERHGFCPAVLTRTTERQKFVRWYLEGQQRDMDLPGGT